MNPDLYVLPGESFISSDCGIENCYRWLALTLVFHPFLSFLAEVAWVLSKLLYRLAGTCIRNRPETTPKFFGGCFFAPGR